MPLSPHNFVNVPASSTSYTALDFYEEPFTLDLHHGDGYPKINIGDYFGANNRFEILRKLGWGRYATTWLVKDHEKDQPMAMKILTTFGTHLERGEVKDPGRPHLHEADIMRSISRPTSSLGAQYCLHLIDSFYVTRDTGKHLCLLTEVAGLSLDELQSMVATDSGFPSQLAKLFVKQICLALDYLHRECRVVHNDVKSSNLLLTFEPHITEELVSLHLQHRPVQTYPMRIVNGISEETLMSQPLPLPGFEDVNPLKWVIKLADFGSGTVFVYACSLAEVTDRSHPLVAQWLDSRSTDHMQAVQLRAPEIILGRDWNEKVDIWSLGCLTFELLTGKNLFRATATNKWSEEEDVLAAHLETHQLTRFPSHFYSESKHASQYLNEDGTLRNIAEDIIYPKTLDHILSVYKVPINLDDPQSERDLAVSFIERCITLHVGDRATAAELLQHPWLQEMGGNHEGEQSFKRIHLGGEVMAVHE
ncbi:hypothetical protein EW146_g2751 [Bondarzewia mesenterica]|uniref:non-specific serine/threonine protein kinase n=1 Tax=Bondarzewia mesenterica TaxID=1095465 RepID=A0A4S4LZV3_9AGAM|nr:hypothetical protein EW146_g2751 [Bondarzewia mesenterica]